MIIHLQGQLGVAAEITILTRDVPDNTTVAELITTIANDLPEEAHSLILKPDGSLRPSLFIALDDTHHRDTTTLIPTSTQELTLMPPMAGG
jgi:hypothetical protein